MRNPQSVGVRFRAIAVAALLIVIGISARTAVAQTHVKDDGQFFSPAAVKEAEASLAKLKQDKGRTIYVETMDAPPAPLQSALSGGGDPKKAWADFALQQAKQRPADVYLLVTRNPSHLELATEPTLRNSGFDPAARNQATQAILTAFKARDFDGGLREAVDRFEQLPARSNTLSFDGAAASPTAQSPTPSPREGGSADRGESGAPAAQKSGGFLGGIGCVGLLVIGVVLMIVISLVRRLFNRNNPNTGYGPHGQQGYGSPMNQGQGGQGYGQQPGGGFGRGIAGGLLGGLLGGYIGNKTFGNTGTPPADGNANDPNAGNANDAGDASTDYSSGGDFGGGDSGGDSGSSGGDF